MLENIPSPSTMTELLGKSLFEVWQELCSAIDEKYQMERLWNTGGRIGLTNINIVGAVKHFVAYMRKVIALVS